jgi:uncharacterized cupin superfamily protein
VRVDHAPGQPEGEITVYTADQEVVLGPGALLNAPRGVPHTFRVSSPNRARWLVTSSPTPAA